MAIDSRPTSERVKYGTDLETDIINCLNNDYADHGYNLMPSSFFEDCTEKTDCWQVAKDGKKYRSAIKARVSKNDILVAIRDPFYGVIHEDTLIGRDVVTEYFQYITLSKDGETIRVANGKTIHKICLDLWNEFIESVGDLDMFSHPYNKAKPVRVLNSNNYPGCEFWLHYDRWKGTPKILGFIPPSLLKENKEIKYHKLLRK